MSPVPGPAFQIVSDPIGLLEVSFLEEVPGSLLEEIKGESVLNCFIGHPLDPALTLAIEQAVSRILLDISREGRLLLMSDGTWFHHNVPCLSLGCDLKTAVRCKVCTQELEDSLEFVEVCEQIEGEDGPWDGCTRHPCRRHLPGRSILDAPFATSGFELKEGR